MSVLIGRALALALLFAGCTPCKDSTLFLELSFLDTTATALDLDVVLSLDGAAEEHRPVGRARPFAHDTLEIDIPNYRAGSQLSVRVDAIVNDARTGSGGATFTLTPSCTRKSLAVRTLSCGAVATSDPVYVDPHSGNDAPNSGGGEGLCATKTLTFALRYATGTIRLAPGIYQQPDELMPFTLTGNQHLDCNHATLLGGATHDGPGASLVNTMLTGMANQLENCTIIGGLDTTFCVEVVTAGSGSGHLVNNCDISQCPAGTQKGAAVEVTNGGDHLTVSDTTLHDTQFGIDWYGDGLTGSIINNTFSDIRAYDINCAGADDPLDPSLTGSENHHSAARLGPCNGCAGCPF